MLLDALAPLNVALTYTLTVAGSAVDSDTVTRTYAGVGGDGLALDVVSDLTATTHAGVRRVRGYRRGGERRWHASEVAASRYRPIRRDPVAGVGGGSATVATVGVHTDAMQDVLDRNAPMIYLHDTSRCDLLGCPVAPVAIWYVTRESSDVGERVDVGEVEWSLEYALTTHPDPDTILGSTWDEFDAAALTWDALDALALDWDEFDAMDWGSV